MKNLLTQKSTQPTVAQREDPRPPSPTAVRVETGAKRRSELDLDQSTAVQADIREDRRADHEVEQPQPQPQIDAELLELDKQLNEEINRSKLALKEDVISQQKLESQYVDDTTY